MRVFAQKVWANNLLLKSVMVCVGLGVMWGSAYGMEEPTTSPTVKDTLERVIANTMTVEAAATELNTLMGTSPVTGLQRIVDWTHGKCKIWGYLLVFARGTSLKKAALDRLVNVYKRIMVVNTALGALNINVIPKKTFTFVEWVAKLEVFSNGTLTFTQGGYIKDDFVTSLLPPPAATPSPRPTISSPKKLTDLKRAMGQLQAKLQQVSVKLRDLKRGAPIEVASDSGATAFIAESRRELASKLAAEEESETEEESSSGEEHD